MQIPCITMDKKDTATLTVALRTRCGELMEEQIEKQVYQWWDKYIGWVSYQIQLGKWSKEQRQSNLDAKDRIIKRWTESLQLFPNFTPMTRVRYSKDFPGGSFLLLPEFLTWEE